MIKSLRKLNIHIAHMRREVLNQSIKVAAVKFFDKDVSAGFDKTKVLKEANQILFIGNTFCIDFKLYLVECRVLLNVL